MARSLAEETCKLLASGKIREPTTHGVMLSEPPVWSARQHGAPNTRFLIFDVGSFESAEWLIRHDCRKVCVLDFASDSEPGGGWRGNQTGTQEESLCRASSLGVALERLQYPIPRYGCAHVPDVVVFRGATGAVLDVPFHVGVIAAALRDVGGDGEPDAKQLAHLQKKVSGVLAAMASYGYEHIVLGSWGCGAFGNSPSLVAHTFADALGGPFADVFASVTFPEKGKSGRGAFGRAFASLGAETISLAAGGGRREASRASSGMPEPPAPRRGLSAIYGAGASAHAEEDLIDWQEAGMLAQDAARRKDWSAARVHFARCVELRPEWPKGQACLARVTAKEREERERPPPPPADGADAPTGAENRDATAAPDTPALSSGAPSTALAAAPAALDATAASEPRAWKAVEGRGRPVEANGRSEETARHLWSLEPRAWLASAAAPAPPTLASGSRHRIKGVRLLPHERELVERGLLTDVTHEGATAVWLHAESTLPGSIGHGAGSGGSTGAVDSSGASSSCAEPVPMTAVYRPMADPELHHLLKHGVLPSTQPYQTIVRGAPGRAYAEKYLRGAKWVDSSPTTVVEFLCATSLIDTLFAMQCKPEEGTLSHGLGDKGGKGLEQFNASLASGASRHRIVLVKRRPAMTRR